MSLMRFVATFLSVQALCSLAQLQTVDCEADPENMYCCPLQPMAPCLLEGFVRSDQPCSAACQKRYQTLGYDCYKDYKEHFQWNNMRRNCDPQNIVQFNPPDTSFRPPDYGPFAPATTAGAQSVMPSMLLAVVVFFQGLALC
mmetsp:Transcript_84023/g.133180  ORF Transcript_84023/g.133180 Transcript_84023/m.133180 type:complete len:142 (+) Transcript_84023:78-503(+)